MLFGYVVLFAQACRADSGANSRAKTEMLSGTDAQNLRSSSGHSGAFPASSSYLQASVRNVEYSGGGGWGGSQPSLEMF